MVTLLGASFAGIASGQVITEFPIPTADSQPDGIAAGPDGNLWFTERSRQQDRADHDGRRHHRVPDPHGRQRPYRHRGRPGRQPLVHRSSAATRSGGSRRPASSPSSRSPRPAASPRASPPGPDGNLWFTEVGRQQDRADHDGRRHHRVPDPDGRQPASTASRPGPDGNLWFTEVTRQQDRADHDGRRHHRVPDPDGRQPARPASRPARTATSGSPRVRGNKIGRITTAGVITEFPVPTAGSSPVGIAAGPDGNLWFTEYARQQDRADHDRPASSPSSRSPRQQQSLAGIAAGPDGNLWFTEVDGNKIGRITTGRTPTPTDGFDAPRPPPDGPQPSRPPVSAPLRRPDPPTAATDANVHVGAADRDADPRTGTTAADGADALVPDDSLCWRWLWRARRCS